MDKKALMEELEQLGKLYQAGVFSQAEFEAERSQLLAQLKALRGGKTPMPSNLQGSGIGQVHGADVFVTGFAGNQGGTSLVRSGLSGVGVGLCFGK